jgi:hypothetical protein
MELLGEWVMWKLVSVCLEMVLVSVQYIGARFAPNVPQARKSFGIHLMVLLDDEAQVEAHFGLFADSANLNAILVHCLRQTYHWLRKCFDHTRWNS